MGSTLRRLVQLRLVVGFLGERGQFEWWPTTFYQPSSRAFLQPAFSKSFRLSQYHGVVEAARRYHDEHLSVGSYHLFRLPEEIEQDLHSFLWATGKEDVYGDMLQSKEMALDALNRFGSPSPKFHEGPLAVGGIQTIQSANTLEALAGAYASAFSLNTRTYPYLVV